MSHALDTPAPQSAPPTLTIEGDVAAGSPPVNAPGDILVTGSVRVGASLKAAGSITVRGSVESASLHAAHDITIDGALIGSREARIDAAGSVTARLINAATITAAHDITAQLEISSSRLIAGGAVRCPIGHILGGHLTANGGLVCGMLGSPGVGGIPTLVEVAIDDDIRRLAALHAPTILANLERIAKVRTKVQPLMAHLKHLSPQQKETATELLAEAGLLEESTYNLAGRLRSQLADSTTRAVRSAYIAAAIHPGTTIRFPSAQMIIEKPIKSPARLTCEGKGAAAKVVQTNPADRSSTIPVFSLYTDGPIAELTRALALVDQARNASKKAA